MEQTPCEELGYKVGDKFEVLTDNHEVFKAGEVVELHVDDGSNVPYFVNDTSSAGIQAVFLTDVRKIEPTPEKQTPCERLGYKVGDKFEVLGSLGSPLINERTVFTLRVDDGSDCPHFEVGHPCMGVQCIHLDDVRKIEPAGFAAIPPSEYYDVYFRWNVDSGVLVAKHVTKGDIGKYPNVDRTEPSTPRPPQRKHSHYFKDVRHLEEIDVYRVLELFEVRDSRVAHAVKKLLVSGARGTKDQEQDIQEALDTLLRRKEMLEEDGSRG